MAVVLIESYSAEIFRPDFSQNREAKIDSLIWLVVENRIKNIN
jgi:hypothetical protein